jgi:hypothetical protein
MVLDPIPASMHLEQIRPFLSQRLRSNQINNVHPKTTGEFGPLRYAGGGMSKHSIRFPRAVRKPVLACAKVIARWIGKQFLKKCKFDKSNLNPIFGTPGLRAALARPDGHGPLRLL